MNWHKLFVSQATQVTQVTQQLEFFGVASSQINKFSDVGAVPVNFNGIYAVCDSEEKYCFPGKTEHVTTFKKNPDSV